MALFILGKTADLKKTKTFFTANTLGYIMDDLYSIDIDEPDDLKCSSQN